MTHGTRSASQTHRNRMCPGSCRMIEQIETPEVRDSIYATEGEEKHDLTNRILDGEIVDCEVPRDVLETVEAVREIEAAVRMEYGDFVAINEVQVDLSEIGYEQTDANNRIDRVLIVPSYGNVVIDYKFGVRYVPAAPWNDQLKAYAWGSVQHWGGQWVWAHVIQPNATSGNVTSEAQWPKEDLIAVIGPELMEINKRTWEPESSLVRGRHCDFCPARDVSCPLHHGSVSLVPQNIQVADHLRAIGPVERSELLENLKALKGWAERSLKTIEALAVDEQLEFQGHEMGTGNSKRSWADDEKAMPVLFELALDKGKTMDDLYKLITPAQAEKLLGKSKAVKEALEPLIKTEEGEPKLVRRKRDA